VGHSEQHQQARFRDLADNLPVDSDGRLKNSLYHGAHRTSSFVEVRLDAEV
jgi:hypothetical protein